MLAKEQVLLGFALSCALTTFASQADAMCKGKQRVSFSDGGQACVLEAKQTKISASQGVRGAGPAARRSSVGDGVFIAMKVLATKDTPVQSRSATDKRAKEICQRYRGGFLKKITKPGNPFMVVYFTRDDALIAPGFEVREGKEAGQRIYTRINANFSRVFLTKNCWIRRAG